MAAVVVALVTAGAAIGLGGDTDPGRSPVTTQAVNGPTAGLASAVLADGHVDDLEMRQVLEAAVPCYETFGVQATTELTDEGIWTIELTTTRDNAAVLESAYTACAEQTGLSAVEAAYLADRSVPASP